jgi:ribose transport system permease protein
LSEATSTVGDNVAAKPGGVELAPPEGIAYFAKTYAGVFLLLVLLTLATGALVDNFLTTQNLLNVLQQMSIIGVVALGMTYVILTAGIDLSVGAVLALSGVILALLLKDGVSPLAAMAVAILAGGGVGLVNGLVSTGLNVQPFVVTLATLAIAQGLALTLADGQQIVFDQNSAVLNFIGNGGIGRLSGQFVVFLVLAVLFWLVLRFLPFGRYVYAVGGNPETARLSGIRTKRVLTSVYVISGCCAGLAGVMTTMRLGVGVPTAGALTNLDAIAAVVIGGTSLLGGRGSLWGSVAGAFVLAVIANVLTLLGVSPYQSQMARGFVILAAVLLGAIGVLSIARGGGGGLRDRLPAWLPKRSEQ